MKYNRKLVLLLLPFIGILISQSNNSSNLLQTNRNKINNPKETLRNVDYAFNYFTYMPPSMNFYPRSDIAHTDVDFKDGFLYVNHTYNAVGYAQYLGSMLVFDNNYIYKDFEIELSFSITRYSDKNRWIAINFYQEFDEEKSTYYAANYRMNGRSALTYRNAEGEFNDIFDTSGESPELELGLEHEYVWKIIVNNDKVTTKMNDITIHNEVLISDIYPSDNSKGYISFSFNRTDVVIKSLLLKGNKELQYPEFGDDELVFTRRYQTNLVGMPTMVLDIEDRNCLNLLKTVTIPPSNVIARINKDENILDVNGNVLEPFEVLYKEVLRKQILPIIKIDSPDDYLGAISFLTRHEKLFDIAILSSNKNLLKGIKEFREEVRTIYLVDELPNNTYYEAVFNANIAKANVIMVNQDSISKEKVRDIQGSCKAVWVKSNSSDLVDLCYCIDSEAYGVVTNNMVKLFEAISSYDSTTKIRMPYNVAHRGLNGIEIVNENSISGIEKAIEYGSTHFEVDVHPTRDNKTFIAHGTSNIYLDSSNSTYTGGSLNIEENDLDYIRSVAKHKLNNEEFATLEDIFDLMERHENIKILLELKTNKPIIVNLVRDILENYNHTTIKERLVVIAFNTSYQGSEEGLLLKRMYDLLPEIPTAYLGGVSRANFINNLKYLMRHNTVISNATSTNNYSIMFQENYCRDRGLVNTDWTLNTNADYLKAWDAGMILLTSNSPGYMKDLISYVSIDPVTLKAGQKMADLNNKIDGYAMYFKDYNEQNYTDIELDIISYREYEDKYIVHCSYEYVGPLFGKEDIKITYYAGGIVNKAKVGKQNDQFKVYPEAIIFGVLGVLIIAGGLTASILRAKKNKKDFFK